MQQPTIHQMREKNIEERSRKSKGYSIIQLNSIQKSKKPPPVVLGW
jgi:hypothetical protein